MALYFNNQQINVANWVYLNSQAQSVVYFNSTEVWRHGIPLQNIIVNSGFMSGATGWTFSTDTNNNYRINTSGGAGGSSSFLDTWYSTGVGKGTQTVSLQAGHSYYLRATGKCSVTQNNFVLSSSSANTQLTFSGGTGWVTNSVIWQSPSSEIYTVSIGMNIAHVGGTAQTTSLLLIDLTASYGSSIPSIGTCNAWPWFDGTYLVT